MGQSFPFVIYGNPPAHSLCDASTSLHRSNVSCWNDKPFAQLDRLVGEIGLEADHVEYLD